MFLAVTHAVVSRIKKIPATRPFCAPVQVRSAPSLALMRAYAAQMAVSACMHSDPISAGSALNGWALRAQPLTAEGLAARDARAPAKGGLRQPKVTSEASTCGGRACSRQVTEVHVSLVALVVGPVPEAVQKAI